MMSDVNGTLTRVRLPDQVALALLRAIVGGDFGPDQQLPTEQEVGQRFGVSRTVVREAVRILAAKGLVEVRHGRGMWVTRPADWDPLDTEIMRVRFERGEFGDAWWQFTEARMVFEAETAALAAGRRDEADLAALADALERMRGSVGDSERYRLADIDFHLHLVRAAHNSVLVRILEPVHALLKAGGMRPPLTFSVEPALENHRRVLAAIERGDRGGAHEAMARLFPTTGRDGVGAEARTSGESWC